MSDGTATVSAVPLALQLGRQLHITAQFPLTREIAKQIITRHSVTKEEADMLEPHAWIMGDAVEPGIGGQLVICQLGRQWFYLPTSLTGLFRWAPNSELIYRPNSGVIPQTFIVSLAALRAGRQ